MKGMCMVFCWVRSSRGRCLHRWSSALMRSWCARLSSLGRWWQRPMMKLLDVRHSKGPGNTWVSMIQGNKLVTEYTSTGTRVNMKVLLLLQFVPGARVRAWAPYLVAARWTVRRLIEGNIAEQHHKDTTAQLEQIWIRAACSCNPSLCAQVASTAVCFPCRWSPIVQCLIGA